MLSCDIRDDRTGAETEYSPSVWRMNHPVQEQGCVTVN
jgi:hypothetical protein